MHDDSFDPNLPDDLREVADALRREREVADGHLLERVLSRVAPTPAPRRTRGLLSVRSTATIALALVCAIGLRLAHVNLQGTAAALVDTVTSSTSDTSTGSAAGSVYCGSGSVLGFKGWAPSFRWHYGYPSGLGTADDGWSASVQPSCPSGSLSIVFHDDTLAVAPGATLYGGWDFHAANDPAFTLTAWSPTITFSPVACSNGSTPSQSSITLAMPTASYPSPQNSPSWIPTGTKTDPAGFQGQFSMPSVCGTASVLISGGSFTTTMQAH